MDRLWIVALDRAKSEGVFSFRKQVADQVAQIKKPTPLRDGLFHLGRLAVTYFRAGNPHYHRRRGVSPSCSGWEGVGPTRYGRQANLREVDRVRSTPRMGWACGFNNLEEVLLGSNRQHKLLVLGIYSVLSPFELSPASLTQGYRIKSHGQLVSVSLTCCHASTPDLSTRWSSATLQVTYITGRLILRQVSRLDAFSAYLFRT